MPQHSRSRRKENRMRHAEYGIGDAEDQALGQRDKHQSIHRRLNGLDAVAAVPFCRRAEETNGEPLRVAR